MKIAIDCRMYSSNFTGIGRYVHELVDHFIKLTAQNGHELVLFFNDPEYSKFNTKKHPNVTKVRVNCPHYSFKEQSKLPRLIKSHKPDITHFPHFNVPLLFNKPFTTTIHDLTLSFHPGKKMTKPWHRLAYHLTLRHAVKRAKKIFTVSNNTKKDVTEHLKIEAQKIQVTPLGISDIFYHMQDQKDLKQLEKTLKKYQITKQFLLYTGVWRSHKNLTTLLQAFADLDIDLQLVLTGKPDPNYPEVKNTITKLNLEDRVILPGLVPEQELNHLYNGALFYIFPSLYEGFGLPPLESMRCGTPVIAANTSSIPEVCGTENAIFFQPHSPADLTTKITQLFKDPALQAKLVERGFAHTQQFSWTKTATTTFDGITKNR